MAGIIWFLQFARGGAPVLSGDRLVMRGLNLRGAERGSSGLGGQCADRR